MSLLKAADKFDYSRGFKVQHVTQVGHHEKLRTHDPGDFVTGPFPHQSLGDAERRRGPSRETGTKPGVGTLRASRK